MNNEEVPVKRSPSRQRDNTDSGKKWGEPIRWEHEEEEERKHGDKVLVPVRRNAPQKPFQREAPIPPPDLKP